MPKAAPRNDSVRLLREVAVGPTGIVFAGERRAGSVAEPVAVKWLPMRSRREVELLLARRAEGRTLAAARLRHAVPADAVAIVGDRLALLSPWVDGLDVLEWVEILRERELELPPRVVCEIVRQVATALDGALTRQAPGRPEPLGVVHRDVKPTNLMVDRDGVVAVLDFGTGFTSLAGRGARAGALRKGLVRYMSPARRDGKRAGPQDDVYGLGIVTLELLRGRWLRRLHAQNPAHDRHLAEVVAELPDLRLGGDGDEHLLRNCLLRMIAHDPDARPSAAEVAQVFLAVGDRAAGPSLAAFAAEHVVPFIPPWPDADDDEVREGRTIDDPSDLPPVAESDGDLPAADDPTDWIETAEGWRVVDDPDDDDDDDTLPPGLIDPLLAASPTPPPPPLAATPITPMPRGPSAPPPFAAPPPPRPPTRTDPPAALTVGIPVAAALAGLLTLLGTALLVGALWLWSG